MDKNRYLFHGEQFYGLELAARRERSRETAKLIAAAFRSLRGFIARFLAKPTSGVRHA